MNSDSPVSSATTKRGIRLSLGRKMAAAFAVLTFFAVVQGSMSIIRMALMNQSITAICDDHLPRMRDLGRLATMLQRTRVAEGRYVMCTSLAECNDANGKLEAALATTETLRASYEPRVGTDEERRGYRDVFDPSWSAYRNDDNQIHRLKEAGAEKAARALFVTKSSDDLETLTAFLDWDLGYNVKTEVEAAAHIKDVFTVSRTRIITSIVGAVLLSFLSAWALIRHISRPLIRMTNAMSRLAARDVTIVVPCLGRKDEIGAMAAAVQVFKDNMINSDRLAIEQQSEREERQARSARIESLVQTFETQIGGTVSVLTKASTEMETTAASMTGNAAQTDRQAVAVAQAAEESSLGVQTVAAASEQLASSITEINRQVASSSTLTGSAVESVRRTDDTVRKLSESADRIGQVISLITSIASQTNLLALNATIEAARAGDAGKGFAVVASEVKSLAQQTARATDEIAAQIAQVQAATSGAVEAIHEIGGIIEQVGAITTSIAAAVEQQGAATAEIARNVQQTAVSTQTVTSNIAGVSRAANDTGTAASQVLGAAGDLSRQAGQLSSEVHSFIASVRSA